MSKKLSKIKLLFKHHEEDLEIEHKKLSNAIHDLMDFLDNKQLTLSMDENDRLKDILSILGDFI